MVVDPVFVVPLSLLAAALLGGVGLIIRLGLTYGTLSESVVLTFVGSVSTILPLLLVAGWPPAATPAALAWFALDGLFSFLAVSLLYRGVKSVGPSVSYALKSTAPLTAVFLATVILREVEPWPVYLGVLLAVSGVSLLSIERIEGMVIFDRRVLYPLLGACLFGTANLLRRLALPEVSSPLVGLAVAISCSLLAALVWLRLRREPLRPSRGAKLFLLGGVFQGLALVLVYTALRSGHVAIVVPLYTSSPIFVLALSPLVLGRLERLTPRVVIGVLTVLAGVLLISMHQ